MGDTETKPGISCVDGIRTVTGSPINAILSLNASQRNYEAGVGYVRTVGNYWVGRSRAIKGVACARHSKSQQHGCATEYGLKPRW